MLAICVNIVILFALSFDYVQRHLHFFENLDNGFTVFFFVEMLIKIRISGWKDYIKSGWNRLDFVIVVLTMPSLLLLFFDLPDFSALLILRALRVAKFFRFLQFIPNLAELMNGVGRALRASVFVLIAFFLYIIIISLFTCYLFKQIAPEFFGNALISCYSIFKMFTLEGWYEIPETISKKAPNIEFFVKLYFIFIVFTGGIFGISIVNAIFVDEMVSDNNDALEQKIDKLEKTVSVLINEIREMRK